MEWFRLYHDTAKDPKFRLIANESGQTVANVLAVWLHLLINASENKENRGVLRGWNDRVVGASIDIPGSAVTAIREQMQGLLLDGDRLTGWDKRQRSGSDDAAARKAISRAKQRQNEPPPDDDNPNHGGNGLSRDMSDNVTGRSRDKPDMSRDKQTVSRDSHGTSLARDRLQSTEESLGNVDSEKRLFPAQGPGENKVAYQGLTFSLSAKTFSEYQRLYWAIPDFMTAVQSIDAAFHAEGVHKPNARLCTRLLHEHQYWENRKAKEAERQKPQAVVRRSGNRVIGGSKSRAS